MIDKSALCSNIPARPYSTVPQACYHICSPAFRNSSLFPPSPTGSRSAVSKNEKEKKPTVYIIINSVSLLLTPYLLALAIKNACDTATLQQSEIPFPVLLINLTSTITNPQSDPQPFPPSPSFYLFLTRAISCHFWLCCSLLHGE